ncbi:OFA family MFS transporter [Haoranjiania flava]|uniref:OFA family MFS transporter n=1 Tax=Haoranjiania flava TaxID=1856322 RepID=A0AAE3ILU0_9BACT|nr:OFA family MFS transporter [Haoranjiania flava]MCU7693305.1 OFA family MFS transporter [Haoranjiania flava]
MRNNRWLIAIMGTVIQLGLGTVYAWSFFQKPIADAYRWSNTEVAWAFSLAIFMLGISAAWGGVILPKYGPKKLAVAGGLLYALGYFIASFALQQHSLLLLYLGFGVVGGIGLGLAYVTPVTTASKWFPDKQGLVTGMVVMGFGLGAVLMSKILAPVFMDLTGGNMSAVFMYIGITLLILLPLSALFMRFPPEEKIIATKAASGVQQNNLPVKKAIFSKQFLVIWFIFMFNVVAGMIFISFQSPLLQDLMKFRMPANTDFQSPETVAGLAAAGATLIALSSICNGLGRFVWGAASDKIGRIQTFRLLLGAQAIVFLALIFLKEPLIFSVLVCFVLLCYGGGFGVIPSFVKDVFGARLMPVVYGSMLTAWGVGGILGPQIVAYMKDHFGEKAGVYAFSVGLVILLLGLVLSLLFKKGEQFMAAQD